MLPRLAFALLLTLGLCGCTLLAPRDPLQIDLAGHSSTVTAERIAGFGGAPNKRVYSRLNWEGLL